MDYFQTFLEGGIIMSYHAGIDLGGTKSAACLAEILDGKINILKKSEFPTIADNPRSTLLKLTSQLRCLISDCCIADDSLESIGISCGGPLDSAKGLILSPPNLPAWDHIHVCKWFSEQFGIPAYLENDQECDVG